MKEERDGPRCDCVGRFLCYTACLIHMPQTVTIGMPHNKTLAQVRGIIADAPFGDDIGILSGEGVARGQGRMAQCCRISMARL